MSSLVMGALRARAVAKDGSRFVQSSTTTVAHGAQDVDPAAALLRSALADAQVSLAAAHRAARRDGRDAATCPTVIQLGQDVEARRAALEAVAGAGSSRPCVTRPLVAAGEVALGGVSAWRVVAGGAG